MRRWMAGVAVGVALMGAGCADEAAEVKEGAEGAASSIAEGARDVKDAAERTATSLSDRAEQATRLRATLTGSAEVPSPGDPDGTGTAMLNVDITKTELCYEVSVQKIDRPVGMHIHQAEAGQSGPVVVTLTTPSGSDSTTSGCANANAGLVSRIAANPGDFYVNVHTETHPDGAVRGQLQQ